MLMRRLVPAGLVAIMAGLAWAPRLVAQPATPSAPAKPAAPVQPPAPGTPAAPATPAPPAAAAPPALGPGQVSLASKLAKDQAIKFRMEIDTTAKTVVGTVQTVSVKHDLGVVLHVQDVSPSGSVVQLVYESIRTTARIDNDTIEFDSANPAEKDTGNDLALALRPVVGAPLTLSLDADGAVRAVVSGGEEFQKPNKIGSIAFELIGNQVVKARFSRVFCVKRGGGGVKVGDTWTSKETVETPTIKYTISNDLTLESMTGTDANIAVKGKIELDNGGSSGAAPGMFTMKDSSVEGRYVWDSTAGLPRTVEFHQRTAMEISVPGAPAVSRTNTTAVKVTRRD